MSRGGGKYRNLHLNTGVLCDPRPSSGHFLCAALATLANRAKQIPQHLVTGSVTPLDVDFGPYNLSTDSETAYEHALHGFRFIGRKAGDMMIAGKAFSISAEFFKICPSLLIRPISMNMDIQGSLKISLNSHPRAYCRDNITVKQEWPPFTLWSKFDLQDFAQTRGDSKCGRNVIEHGLSYHDWGMFLSKLTGDFPPNPPFLAQGWGGEEHYQAGSGESHSKFATHLTDIRKKTSVFRYHEEYGRSLWTPL